MNEEKQIKRIHITTSIAFSSIIAMVGVMRIFRVGITGLPLSLGYFIAAALMDLYLIKFKGSNIVKRYILGTSLIIGCCVLFISNGFSLQSHYIVICSLAIMVLFFDPKMFAHYCIALLSTIAVFYFVKPEAILGPGSTIAIFFYNFTVLTAICILLYLLTKWGNKSLMDAMKNQQASEQKSNEIEQILTEVKDGALAIENGVRLTNQNTMEMNQLNQEVLSNVNSMKNSIKDRVNQMHVLSEEMELSLGKIEQAQNQSDELTLAADNVQNKVDSALTSVEDISSKMEVLSQSSDQSVSYMKELADKIGEVSQLLNGIQDICNQTTMLSLNASIEAARAGESGKGFAVVAHSIGDLAQSSSQIVVKINKLNEEMVHYSNMVSDQVEENSVVTQEGKNLILTIKDSFDQVCDAIHDSNRLIMEEVGVMDVVSQNFRKARQEITEFSEQLTENMNDMERINDSMVQQETKLHHITKNMNDLQEDGASLNKYFQQN